MIALRRGLEDDDDHVRGGSVRGGERRARRHGTVSVGEDRLGVALPEVVSRERRAVFEAESVLGDRGPRHLGHVTPVVARRCAGPDEQRRRGDHEAVQTEQGPQRSPAEAGQNWQPARDEGTEPEREEQARLGELARREDGERVHGRAIDLVGPDEVHHELRARIAAERDVAAPADHGDEQAERARPEQHEASGPRWNHGREREEAERDGDGTLQDVPRIEAHVDGPRDLGERERPLGDVESAELEQRVLQVHMGEEEGERPEDAETDAVEQPSAWLGRPSAFVGLRSFAHG